MSNDEQSPPPDKPCPFTAIAADGNPEGARVMAECFAGANGWSGVYDRLTSIHFDGYGSKSDFDDLKAKAAAYLDGLVSAPEETSFVVALDPDLQSYNGLPEDEPEETPAAPKSAEQEGAVGWVGDMQRQEHTIKAVTTDDHGWVVTTTDCGSIGVGASQCSIHPRVGERMLCFGKGFAYAVRGVVIGGRVYSYQTIGEYESQLETERAARLVAAAAPTSEVLDDSGARGWRERKIQAARDAVVEGARGLHHNRRQVQDVSDAIRALEALESPLPTQDALKDRLICLLDGMTGCGYAHVAGAIYADALRNAAKQLRSSINPCEIRASAAAEFERQADELEARSGVTS